MTAAPFWVTFPTHAVNTDWNDHGQAHRAVMRLFERHLPGDAHERRATGQILYRVDQHLDGQSSVLVQTRHPVEVLPPAARATTVPPSGWEIPQGQPVMFRVAVNPVRRRTERSDDGRRREVVSSLALPDVPPWLADKLAIGLNIDEILNHTRRTLHLRSRASGTPPRLVLDTLDGIATVTDAAALQRLRLDGIGRGKAYGAGLLTVRALG